MKNQQKKQQKNNFFNSKHPELLISLIVFLVVGLLAYLDVLDILEYKSYDVLLQLKPDTQERDDIVIAAIDDYSIAEVGTYPWPRDVLGDVIIKMRELGAKQVSFDIEFLDPSKKGLTPNAEQSLPESFLAAESEVGAMFSDFSTAIVNGDLSFEYIDMQAQDFIQYYIPQTFGTLEKGINDEIFFDFDAYFAQALRFFGDSWITINAGDLGIAVDESFENYVRKNMLLDNVVDSKNLISKGDMTPALETFIRSANGAGFTNIVLDTDGVRRRLKLLSEIDGQYIAQLVFAPLLSSIDSQALVREKNQLVIKDALFPGEKTRRDVTIPLDEDGCFLINWIPDSFAESFKNESVSFLLNLEDMETALIDYLTHLASLRVGNSSHYDAANYLLYEYADLQNIKSSLWETAAVENLDDDSLFDDYLSRRVAFFEMCSELTDPFYLDEINGLLDQMTSADNIDQMKAIKTDIETMFVGYSEQLDDYNELYTDLKASFDGAFVIVGHTATGSTDLGTTPFHGHYPNIGTHANVYNSIMNESFITPIPFYYSVILAFVLILSHAMVAKRMSLKKRSTAIRLLSGVIFVIIVPVLGFCLIQCNYYFAIMYPLLSVFIAYIGVNFWNFFVEEKDKKFLRQSFETFLSDDVVEEIVASGKQPELGGVEREITALFSDIKGFSSFSEKLSPKELVDVLNMYLTALSDEILINRGTIDKYIGDAIVAIFGAPVSMEDHAWQACVSAIRMKQAEVTVNENLKEVNEKLIAEGKTPMEIKTRIGLNSGNMVVGNMGTSKKMNYTMMGDDVNLAARLESGVKKYEEWVMISEPTWNAANSGENEGKLLARRLDKVRVVGRTTPVQLYNLLGFKDELPQNIHDSVEIFHQALDLCNESVLENSKEKLRAAKQGFEKVLSINPEDGPAKVFIARCSDFLEKGFPKNWDGVINWTSK